MTEAPLIPREPAPSAEPSPTLMLRIARFSLAMVRKFKGEGYAATLVRIVFARIGIWANDRAMRRPGQ